ncbi:hypothetical protein [Arthrobacter sp. IK3]|uniref:hypothetical protein n=1 Tax=Arthrobacter sp. IK3 TaxID=3448169 RepID=UPI003EE11263
MATAGDFNYEGVSVTYKFRPAQGDRQNLVVIFSGFRAFGTYDFDSVSSGLRGNILWIQDQFFGNYSYYLCHDLNFRIRDAVHALIEATRIELGLDKQHCTVAGFSKGGSAALYFGIKYDYGAIVSTVPQMNIGSYAHKNWPKAFEAMTISGSDEERKLLDNILPSLIIEDDKTDRNIYLFSSPADIQFTTEVEPYLQLFAKYENFNFVLTDSPLVREHIMVTRYNVPLILSVLAMLIDGVAPRLGAVKNGSGHHASSLPRQSLEKVRRRQETVVKLTAAPIKDGRLYAEGYGFVKGYEARRYGDIKWTVLFEGSAVRHAVRVGGTPSPELSNQYYDTEYCDYSIAGFATLGHKGINLDDLPDGLYKMKLELTHGGVVALEDLPSTRPVEIWGESGSSVVGVLGTHEGTTLIKRPVIGAEAHGAYFQEIDQWIRGMRYHVEGYFAVPGFETPRYADVSYYLVLKAIEEDYRTHVFRLGSAHRDGVSNRFADAWGDYSKSYYATPQYEGVDISALAPGKYQVNVSARFGRTMYSKRLASTLVVTDGEIAFG